MPYSDVTFRNDIGRTIRLGWCANDPTCRHVHHWIAIDPGAEATEQIPSDGLALRRFVAVGPPEVVYGCFTFRLDGRQPERVLSISTARGCGSGR